jgi:NADH-quinone oxidoreductase subunit A
MTSLYEYYRLFATFIFSLVLSNILLLISYFLAPKRRYKEKLSAYECGFDPIDGTRGTFEVHFYIVGILFLIFDLEIAYLFPWALSLQFLPFMGFVYMYIFGIIITLGFIYEWKKGALDWSKFIKLS